MPTAPINPTAVASLEISGLTELTAINQTSQLGVTVTLANGSTQPASTGVVWKALNPAVVTVSADGRVTAVGLGVGTVSASYQSRSTSKDVDVVASSGQIGSCGVFTGPGPFTIASDISATGIGCLQFSGNVSGSLDCGGHDVSSITLFNVQSFSIRRCILHAGLNGTLRITNSRGVTIDVSDVLGSVSVNGSQDTVLTDSAFRWPVLPASDGFQIAEVVFSDGLNNRLLRSGIDGGWDGNMSTYQRQGCDDGVLIQNQMNSVIQGNTITNTFDAGIESIVNPGPVTTSIEGNTIIHAGYTGIGGYYVPGWQNSTFRDNVVKDTPSLLDFNAIGVKQNGTVTFLTFINNQITNNTLLNSVALPALYGGGRAPSMRIDYVTGGVAHTVAGNLVAANNLGASNPGPFLDPTTGFIDGGGNTCSESTVLSCLGGSRTLQRLIAHSPSLGIRLQPPNIPNRP